jgi:hypothetical protein
MMAPILGAKTPGAEASQEASQDLAQFEPDPEGQGSSEPGSDGAAPREPADPQWIVWDDPERESAWAAAELTQIGAGWRD